MNLAMVIAVYASIREELGLPPRFPGSAECCGKLAPMTDAAQLATGSEWATDHATSATAFNLTYSVRFEQAEKSAKHSALRRSRSCINHRCPAVPLDEDRCRAAEH